MTIQNSHNYRQKEYFELLRRCCVLIPDFMFTGRGFSLKELNNLYEFFPELRGHAIPWKESLTLSEIESNYEKVNFLFLFDTKSLTIDAEISSKKVILFITDHLRPSDERLKDYTARNLIFEDVNYVLYNYTYQSEVINQYFQKALPVHFPCWSSDHYDFYKKNPRVEKVYDYLLSGNSDPEYSWREKYRSVLRQHILWKNFIDNLKPKEWYSLPFSEFRKHGPSYSNLLMSSNFCLCDGGVNGRVTPKHYEAMYANSIIVTPYTGKELEKVGIVDGETAIVHQPDISVGDLVQLLSFPENKYNLEKIRKNAYNLTSIRHNTDARIRLILELCKLNQAVEK